MTQWKQMQPTSEASAQIFGALADGRWGRGGAPEVAIRDENERANPTLQSL